MLSTISSWFTTLSLIFGGCCANALTLEQLTSIYPNFGSLITFLQFVLISLHGLPTHLTWTRYGPRFKERRVPLTPYLGQVALFYFISLLNNAAFAYHIPMPVHIIFRSGGLIVSMLLGWLISKKRYNVIQIVSVLLVTSGVALTTLSASQSSSSTSSTTPSNPYTYATGIGILSLALFLSGFLGLLQDWTYTKYGRPSTASTSLDKSKPQSSKPSTPPPSSSSPATWQESMFYLHFLALPLFLPLFPEIRTQISTINYHSPRAEFSLTLPPIASSSLNAFLPPSISDVPPILPPHRLPTFDNFIPDIFKNNSFLYIVSTPPISSAIPSPSSPSSSTSIPIPIPNLNILSLTLSLPKPYLPLLLNTITQLFCVAGVHRLTTRVTNLTVTLVLVVRKAVSLVISLKGGVLVDGFVGVCRERLVGIGGGGNNKALNVGWEVVKVLFGVEDGGGGGGGAGSLMDEGRKRKKVQVNERMLWSGAALVLIGTVGYTIGTNWGKGKKGEAKEGKAKGKTE